MGLALPSGALAADNISVDLGNGGSAAYDGKGNLTVGNQATAEGSKNQGQHNTAIGTNADTLRNVMDGETTQNGQPLDTEANKKLVDGEGQAHKLDISTESGGSIAVGYNNKAEGDNSTALGNTAKIINKPVVYYADAAGNKTASADNAAWYKDASGNPTKVPRVFRDANGNTTTTPQYKYTHTVTAEDGTTSTVTDITSDISKANKDSNNNPEYSYQKSDNTDYLYSVTLYQAHSNSIAAGTDVTANGSNALAAGVSASASGENAVAIGYGAKAEGKGATVIGQYGKATGRYALAFGGQQTDTTAEQADNVASGDNALSFGERTTASGTNSTAFGWQTTAKEKRATAFGERTTASGANATAFGQLATASGQNSVAFGNEAVANNYGSTAFGNRTEALGEYSIAFGNSTVAAGMNTVAFGTDNVAGAVLDDNGAYTNIIYQTNPKNGRVVKDKNGNPIELSREKMDARGNLAYTDNNGSTKSVTYTVSGGETHSYVLLQGTDGNTYIRDYRGNIRSATIGTDGTVTVGDTASAAVTLKQATAGANGYHILSNANATVWGENSIASGEVSTAFGVGSIAAAKNSLAVLGGTIAASATNAAAIGSGAKATLEDSVALGSGAVADRASGAKGYDMLTKGNTTNTSTAWVSNANAIAVGNGSTLTRQITGVAAGSQDTDAVNVAQLKAAGFKVTTQNNGNISSSILNGDTLDFEGRDNAIVSTSKDSKTITVAVSRTPTFDSATFYNPNPSEGQNNEKVTISNGHISTYNKDQQERAVLGTDNQGSGTLHLINNDLSQVHVYTQNSKEDGNDGITRMYYISSSGNGGEIQGIHTIAVLDDGINYAGDNVKPNTSDKVVVKHKLNSTMDITGGADTNNLAGGNIGVVATPAVEDDQGNITQKAKLELKLNKDLIGLNTVTAGTAKIGNHPADTLKFTQNGQVTETTAPAGSYVTGLDNKYWNTTNPSYVSGRAATEDQLAAVSGTINQGLSFTTNTKDAANTTDNYKGYKVVNRKLGDTISIKAGDADPLHHYATTNLTTEIANTGDITIKMDENPTFNVVTATSVNLSPKDITTKDQAGYTASARLDAHYRDASLNPNKNVTMADGSTGMVRLHYHDGEGTIHDLATMDDGQVYVGDIKTDGSLDTTGFGRKMNEKTTINGGVTDKANLSDNNIGVVSNGTDTLTVKLAKDLKNLNSVTTGKTVMNDKGLTIKKSDDDSSKNVIVLGDQVAFGDNQVNNMGSGASKITEDDKGNKTYEYNMLNNGANIGDVKNIASSTVQPVIDTVNKGWELDVNGTKQKAVTPDSPKVNLIQGQNITITGDTANTENVTIATADDVRFNTVRVGGSKTDTDYTGGIVIGKQSGGASANPDENDYITGLKNTNWDSNKIQSGRAATEDQLKKVADDIKQGTVAGDVYVTGGEVAYHTDGGTDNGQTTVNDGTGKLTLTENNKTSKVEITGLHDYYVTGGTVTDDGTKLELTRNDRDSSGNPQKITVDLSNVLSNDLHLVQNPAEGSEGKYKVDTTTGTVTLKVQNADGTKSSDITIGGFEGLGQGLEFGANKMAKDGGGNPVTNQLGSTIKITGAGTKELKDYSGKNLLTSVEQDDQGNTIVHVLMDKNISADGVTVGQAGTDGVAGADGEIGQAGTIGINGKNGVAGEGGKEGITTTIIHTEKGQPGENGATGKPGVDGKDITRIVYQNDQDQVDGKDGTHTVATLDDGLKFSGDDNKVIQKKLNEQLQFVGGADKDKLTQNNIGINELEDGKLTIQLVNTPDLGTKGNLKAGDAHIGWFDGDALNMTKDGTNPSGNKAAAGSYATGLSNKDWNVADPEYVSGRAATEDQLAKVSEAIGNATTAAGKRTVVTVNDKANPAEAEPGANAYGDYKSNNGNLMIAAKKDDEGQMTYNIKLNDNLAIGQKGADGKDGTDGKFTVETSKGTTVVIGHDGEPGQDGKDGISVKGQDGKDGVTLSVTNGKDGKDGSEGHIGLTGPKGKDGKDASADIHVKNGQNGVDGTDGNKGKDGMDRIVYEDHNGKTHEVATLDDGLKFVGNDGQEVSRKLNETLSIKGGLDKDAVATASSKNLGVHKSGDGLEIVMTDTPDFTKVTVGGDTKITIGGQTNSDTKNPANGNYITGLDNTQWDKDHVTENRAATEGQLKEAINGISGKDKGGFGLAAETGGSVKQDLGGSIAIKGDTTYKEDGTTVDKKGNIKTSVDNGVIKVELNKDVDLGQDGSVKAGNTTINKDGVDTNKVTIKDSTISISKDGINAGGKQITYVASGGDVGSNAANIDDVKRIAGNMKTEINNNVTEVTNKVNQMGDELTQVKQDVKADRQYLGDEGTAKKVNVKFGSALSLTGGAQVDNLAGEGNIGVIQKEMDDPDHAGQKINGLSIRLAKDLTGLTSVTTGNTTINNGGLTVKNGDANRTITVQDGNVNMGGNQIHNVAPGTAPTDAVNVSQLQQTGRAINQLGSSLDKLGTRVDRVGANSAALAALHPLDFDPDDKLDFAVGAGNYSGANAVALGAFYRPNEDVMFSLGGSTGGGENMVNLGATFKLGQHNHVSNSRVAMAKEIRDLKALVARQDGEMQQLKTLMNQLAGKPVMRVDKDALFPDIPENHWAYEYVIKLARAGIIEGYEDGQFKGDRMMTRYEFAALLYRAIMAGAAANPDLNQDGTLGKLVKEFDGELKYIRIDVIEKDKHGKPTIERVRTVEDSEKHHGK